SDRHAHQCGAVRTCAAPGTDRCGEHAVVARRAAGDARRRAARAWRAGAGRGLRAAARRVVVAGEHGSVLDRLRAVSREAVRRDAWLRTAYRSRPPVARLQLSPAA